jgi:hypothetical protein
VIWIKNTQNKGLDKAGGPKSARPRPHTIHGLAHPALAQKELLIRWPPLRPGPGKNGDEALCEIYSPSWGSALPGGGEVASGNFFPDLIPFFLMSILRRIL